MEKAARMRKAGAASVDDIGLEVGFSDRTGFYRAFKKHFGCTPRALCQGRRPPLAKGSLFRIRHFSFQTRSLTSSSSSSFSGVVSAPMWTNSMSIIRAQSRIISAVTS